MESLQKLLGVEGWKENHTFIYEEKIKSIALKIGQAGSEVVLKKIHVFEKHKEQKKTKTGYLNLVESC